jgi:hypothetical protein
MRSFRVSLTCRHGRDGKVLVWQFSQEGEKNLDLGLPSDGGLRRKPLLLHSVDVNEVNFCGIDIVCTDDVFSYLIYSD